MQQADANSSCTLSSFIYFWFFTVFLSFSSFYEHYLTGYITEEACYLCRNCMLSSINIHISSTTGKPEAVRGVRAHSHIGESPVRRLGLQRQSYNPQPQGTLFLLTRHPPSHESMHKPTKDKRARAGRATANCVLMSLTLRVLTEAPLASYVMCTTLIQQYTCSNLYSI